MVLLEFFKSYHETKYKNAYDNIAVTTLNVTKQKLEINQFHLIMIKKLYSGKKGTH